MHDLRCLGCGTTYEVAIPITLGARRGSRCYFCISCRDAEGPLDPIPAIGRMSVFHEFEKFTFPMEDPASPTGYRQETVSTLADIRRLERTSEQAERDGEGRRMIWRDYANDVSNRDVHTMGPDPSLTPPKHYANQTPVTVRRGEPVIADHGTIEEASDAPV